MIELKNLPTITHQTQPTKFSCAHTCLAMLLGEPVDKVRKVLGDNDCGLSDREIHAALDRFQFLWNHFVYPTMIVAGTYLLAVPSLNNLGGSHCIVVQRDDCGMFKVFDPNKGREGVKVYEEDGSNLVSWHDTIFIYPGGKLS